MLVEVSWASVEATSWSDEVSWGLHGSWNRPGGVAALHSEYRHQWHIFSWVGSPEKSALKAARLGPAG